MTRRRDAAAGSSFRGRCDCAHADWLSQPRAWARASEGLSRSFARGEKSLTTTVVSPPICASKGSSTRKTELQKPAVSSDTRFGSRSTPAALRTRKRAASPSPHPVGSLHMQGSERTARMVPGCCSGPRTMRSRGRTNVRHATSRNAGMVCLERPCCRIWEEDGSHTHTHHWQAGRRFHSQGIFFTPHHWARAREPLVLLVLSGVLGFRRHVQDLDENQGDTSPSL